MQLSNLHWLPVRRRIDFKLALTIYKIISTHQPAYLRSLLFLYEPTRALHLSGQLLLNVPTVTTDFGRRAFSYCAPKIWNEIPAARRIAPLRKLSNTGSKPTCLVLWTIFKHDPTSHLATARASDSVIYSELRHSARYKSTYYYYCRAPSVSYATRLMLSICLCFFIREYLPNRWTYLNKSLHGDGNWLGIEYGGFEFLRGG